MQFDFRSSYVRDTAEGNATLLLYNFPAPHFRPWYCARSTADSRPTDRTPVLRIDSDGRFDEEAAHDPCDIMPYTRTTSTYLHSILLSTLRR